MAATGEKPMAIDRNSPPLEPRLSDVVSYALIAELNTASDEVPPTLVTDDLLARLGPEWHGVTMFSRPT